jgi:hypothetical protein
MGNERSVIGAAILVVEKKTNLVFQNPNSDGRGDVCFPTVLTVLENALFVLFRNSTLHYSIIFAKKQIMTTQNASSIDFQFLAFSHLSVPVAGTFDGFPLDSKTTFKPLVDEYYEYLNSSKKDHDSCFNKFSSLIDRIASFPWIGSTAARITSSKLHAIKVQFFEASMEALLRLGAFTIHPDNNAWLIIVYTLREMIMIPKDEFKTLFKMIPLVSGTAHIHRGGWGHVPVDTKFVSVVITVIDEGSGTASGRALLDLEDPSLSCAYWHPVLYTFSSHSLDSLPDIYLKHP